MPANQRTNITHVPNAAARNHRLSDRYCKRGCRIYVTPLQHAIPGNIREEKPLRTEANHPLAKVKDGENALAIHTRYYQPIPFVLRGYGAGAAVTAAGVFGDVMRTLGWQQEV